MAEGLASVIVWMISLWCGLLGDAVRVRLFSLRTTQHAAAAGSDVRAPSGRRESRRPRGGKKGRCAQSAPQPNCLSLPAVGSHPAAAAAPPSYDGRVEWGQERRGQVQNDARWTAHAIEEARRRRIALWRHPVSAQPAVPASRSCNREPVQREALARDTSVSYRCRVSCALPRVQIRRLEAHAVQVGMHFGCERSLDTLALDTHTL